MSQVDLADWGAFEHPAYSTMGTMCISRCENGRLIVEEGCVVQIRVVRCAQDLEAVRQIRRGPAQAVSASWTQWLGTSGWNLGSRAPLRTMRLFEGEIVEVLFPNRARFMGASAGSPPALQTCRRTPHQATAAWEAAERRDRDFAAAHADETALKLGLEMSLAEEPSALGLGLVCDGLGAVCDGLGVDGLRMDYPCESGHTERRLLPTQAPSHPCGFLVLRPLCRQLTRDLAASSLLRPLRPPTLALGLSSRCAGKLSCQPPFLDLPLRLGFAVALAAARWPKPNSTITPPITRH